MIQEEKRLWGEGYKYVIGIDEAGRGPLAGPVVSAAALVLEEDFSKVKKIKPIKDSKQLSEKKRLAVYNKIISNSKIKWGIGIVSEKIIDKINIFEATKASMISAVKNLEKKHQVKADYLVLDGRIRIGMKRKQESIVKADSRVFSCSIASIIAKVTRDKIMLEYHDKYPEYCFKDHKGYGTKQHMALIKKHGICPIHRKSFRPCK